MAKQKHYVVWVGKVPGVYESWDACQRQTNGFDKAKFKAFGTKAQANSAFTDGWKKHWGKGKTVKSNKIQPTLSGIKEEVDYNSISVDVGTKGNPGPIEYRGVDTKTGEILFEMGPVEKGTNNLGEFIAIVHALAYLKKNESMKTVYSDSRTALSWISKKRVSSTLIRDRSTEKVWELTDRAINWLNNNRYENKILKWNTEKWGEIKADYGRK